MYKPTEYEEMLIAAGWISIEDMDDDYQKHLKENGEFSLSYQSWKDSITQWEELDKKFRELEELHGVGDV